MSTKYPEVPAICRGCGWVGMFPLKPADPVTEYLYASAGVERPEINRCTACDTGAVEDIDNVFEFEGAVAAHVQRQLAPAFAGHDVEVVAIKNNGAQTVTIKSRVLGRISSFDVSRAVVDGPRFRDALDRVALAMKRELTAAPVPPAPEVVKTGPAPLMSAPGVPALRRFSHYTAGKAGPKEDS